LLKGDAMQRINLVNAAMVVAALDVSGAACAADRSSESKAKTPPSTQATPKAATQTVVYYFHGTNRCHTCRTIEAYADESVKAAFGPELASGQLLWQPLDVDEAANEHFVKDYQLYTRSLVVVDGSNPKRFKNLDKVWQLVGDKPAFLKYVQDEVRAFRKS
jgi:hypothetical protein